MDGSGATTREFWYENGGEVRRFYFGPTLRFLDIFTLKADANLASDESPAGGDLKFGYDSMFELYLTADLSRFLGLPRADSFKLSYGRREQQLTEEHSTSSRDIHTVERSMLDAYILPGVPVPANPTGVWADWKSGAHTLSGGILSSDHGSELSDWGDGRLYWFIVHPELKLMTGLEWERMENSATAATVYDGFTSWMAMRVHF